MNWLYIIVMAYIVISALRGYHKGFIKVIYSTLALLVTIVLVAFMTPLIADVIEEYTPLYDQFESGCEKFVRAQIGQKLEKDGALTDDLKLLESILPEELEDILNLGSRKAVTDSLESQKIYQKIAKTAADFCVNFAAFLIASAAASLFLFIAGRKLDFISKIPGIHLINMIMGFLAGIVKAFIVIWTVFLIIKVTAILPSSAALIKVIEDDAVLKNLYEQNRLAELLKTIMPSIYH